MEIESVIILFQSSRYGWIQLFIKDEKICMYEVELFSCVTRLYMCGRYAS